MVLRLPLLRVSTVTVTVPSPWLAAASQGPVSIAIAPVGGCVCVWHFRHTVPLALWFKFGSCATSGKPGPEMAPTRMLALPLGLWVFGSFTQIQ